MQSPTLERINDRLYLVRHSEDRYVKVMPCLEYDCVVLQQNEKGKHYLVSLEKDTLGYYNYYYYDGYSIKGVFYKQECIFAGKFWQSPKVAFDKDKWLYTIALKLSLEDDLGYPVECLAEYGADSPYKLYVEDSGRVIN